jgi:2-polyprenyl-6-methoxyphenol hydroxylase-like FAD-dependent oxidoreductase
MSGIVLKRLGHDIRILERNPTPLLHNQGAGIVAGGDTQAFFEQYDRTRMPIAVTSKVRNYLAQDGNIIHLEHYEQRMTSWDLLYYLLRANFDGVKSDYVKTVPSSDETEGNGQYDYGHLVTDVKEKGDKVEVLWECTKPNEDIIDQEKSGSLTGDILIGCDGPSSTIRRIVLPFVQRKYANYVAWRGTVPESLASSGTKTTFVERFCFYSSQSENDGTQILAYLIPGANGTLNPGERLINWVWYCTCVSPGPQWDELFTDVDGNKHHYTLPVGKMRPEVWSAQKKLAENVLPPQFAELVNKTEHPFIQAITDVLSTRNCFFDGKCLLVGDALAGFRPHTAASTSQAAYNAMVLHDIMEASEKEREKMLEEMLMFARNMQKHGQALGDRIMPHLRKAGLS